MASIRLKSTIQQVWVTKIKTVLSGKIFAKERKGADVSIQKIDGKRVIGELIAVRKDSLVLLGLYPIADMSVAIEEIKTIQVVKKSKLLVGAGIGLLLES